LPAFTWDIDPILIHFPSWLSFLPVEGIRYYSLLYVGVFLGGYKLLDWQIRRAGGSEEDANDFVVYGVIAVLAGARMGHVFFYEWDRFLRDPMWLFMIHKGGLASHGATIGLLVAMYLFTKLRRQSFIEGCDRFAFSAALGSILVRIGNFFNSEIVGRKTNADWGIRFPRYDGYTNPPLRHPSQLYEVFLGCVTMAVLLWWDRFLGKEKRPRGAMISMFFAVYFSGRFIVEYFKEFQTAMEQHSVFTMGQWLSIIPAVAGYIGVGVSLMRRVPAHWNTFPAPGTNDPKDDDDDEDEDDEGDEDDDAVLLGKAKP
jgi:prolipoprotein diacylglyceryl transferase